MVKKKNQWKKIHNEEHFKSLNKNRISIRDFSFGLRLQYGLAQHFLFKLLIFAHCGFIFNNRDF